MMQNSKKTKRKSFLKVSSRTLSCNRQLKKMYTISGFFRIGMGFAIAGYAAWHLFLLSRSLF